MGNTRRQMSGCAQKRPRSRRRARSETRAEIFEKCGKGCADYLITTRRTVSKRTPAAVCTASWSLSNVRQSICRLFLGREWGIWAKNPILYVSV
jgi:hypothetical protein